MKTWIKRIFILVALLAVAGAATAWYLKKEKAQGFTFETAKISRGDLLVTIAASGTLEPEEVVDVGAQISGQIVAFGKDAAGKTVDYGSVVEPDAVVAKIDDALYQADVAESEAQVESAQASVQRAQADLGQLQAKLLCAERDWSRAKRLGPSEAIAQSSYDAYEAAYEVAKANVAVGEAAILQAKATLTQAEKSLWRAKRNLGYCTITSPVKGTVIDRRVSIGQTVTAGMETPSLFLIAKDLKRLQVWVSVNEADIARVYPGQPVTFTVDALPDETFHGEVYRIRPNASMTQNVVTFTVEISTDNSDEKLRPYLTANVRFEVSRRDHVLLAPVAALAWTPTENQVAPEFRQPPADENKPATGPNTQAASGSATEPLAAHGNGTHRDSSRRASTQPAGDAHSAAQPSSRPAATMTPAFLWVVQDGYVKPIPVLTGVNDGTNVEVVGRDLSEGMEVVTGVQESSGGGSSDMSNPFTPKMPKRPPRGGPPM